MAKAKLTLDVDELQEMIDATASDKVLRELERVGMERVMNVLEAKAVELAPVDTGNLEQSTVVKVSKQGDRLVGEITFATPYSAIVHELPEEARGPKTAVKAGNEYGLAGPKYLERPLRGFAQRMTKDLGEFLQKIWRGNL